MTDQARADSAAPLPHYVSGAPFDPYSVERTTAAQEKIYLASQWRLMALKFRRHRIAVFSAFVLAIMYLAILGVEFLAPYNVDTRKVNFIYVPPQGIHLFHKGEFIGPHIYALDYKLNMTNLKREFTPNPDKPQKIRFFCTGDTYKFWGLIEGDFHLVCPPENGPMYLLGSDRLGRDMLSRILYGMRISLTIGLVGVAVSIVLGIVFGGLAGYYGGWLDDVVQRVIEVVRSIPHLPLWLALAAILPVTWSALWVYFGITIILGLIDWTGLARAVRSRLLSLREEDFCVAAQLMGASPNRIIFRHLMPSFMSHLIASATLAIPNMILGETALSFLGLGIREPIVSWGVLLNDAQNINVVVLYPWLMLPMVPVIVVVLAYNFMGDGLRDAADPYRFVVFPGGYGTLDELFEALTLIQTGKIKHFPVVLFGSAYWRGLIDWLRDTMAKERKIEPSDLSIFTVTDDPAVAVASLVKARQELLEIAAAKKPA